MTDILQLSVLVNTTFCRTGDRQTTHRDFMQIYFYLFFLYKTKSVTGYSCSGVTSGCFVRLTRRQSEKISSSVMMHDSSPDTCLARMRSNLAKTTHLFRRRAQGYTSLNMVQHHNKITQTHTHTHTKPRILLGRGNNDDIPV